jgi:hypothetical protein
MPNKPLYTPSDLSGKFIVCFPILTGDTVKFDCVRYNTGDRKDLPYLYNGRNEAMADQYFDPEVDEVIEASKFFERKTL